MINFHNDICNAWYYVSDLKIKIKKYIKYKEYNKALQLINTCASLLYAINQTYSDEELENNLYIIQQEIRLHEPSKQRDKNKVIFYDGFGLENRGLARIYLRAFIESGFYVIYITRKSAENKISLLLQELIKGKFECHFISEKSNVEVIKELHSLFDNSNADSAFLYAMPNDVNAIFVFRAWEGKIKRYQINLTDHAFWLGKYSFDYCVEFRDYGAGISNHKRGIPVRQIVCLPFYPIIDKNIAFAGFPFDKGNNKVVFSGGALYKTLGAGNKYYVMVDRMLQQNQDAIFWYAGSGDNTEINKIIAKYPKRCYLTSERKDLMEVLKHCDLYLDTYPISGSLMKQYAAISGLPPLQLYHDDDSVGTLLNQNDLGVLYKNMDDLLMHIKKLLSQGKKIEFAKIIKNSVISEKDFTVNVKSLIEKGETNMPFRYDDVDTSQILRTYRENFIFEDIVNCIAIRKNINLWYLYPVLFLRRVSRKLLACSRKS